MEKKVFVDISARHVHLNRQDMDVLFGKNSELTIRKILGGGFAAEERVDLIGPKGTIKDVAILGPFRNTQVEISITDARTLGVRPPIRLSGNTKGSSGITLRGPYGELYIEEGVIIPKRHMHLSEKAAKEFGISDGQIVKVRVETLDRSLVFEEIPCRIQPSEPIGPSAVVHIDTDECNAAGMDEPCMGIIVD